MFDLTLNPYYTGQSSKILIKLHSYLTTLNEQLNRYSSQFDTAPGAETKSIELFERLISTADINLLLSMPDMFYRFTNGVLPVLGELSRMIDPLSNTGQMTDFIWSSRHNTKEYILPVTSNSVFNDFPFGQDWNAWKKVRPLKILHMDTSELTFEAYDDRIHFLHDAPPLVIFSLDISALILMYLSYLDSNNITEFGDTEKLELPKWIHRHVVFPSLLEESVTWWVLSQYKKCLLGATPLSGTFQDYAWVSATYGRIGSQFPQAISDIDSLLNMVQSGTIQPYQALASLQLPMMTSLPDRYHLIHRYCQIPELSQYKWASYMRDKLFLDFTLSLAVIYPHFPETSHLVNYIDRELTLFKLSHPWNRLNDSILTSTVTESISEQERLLTILRQSMNK